MCARKESNFRPLSYQDSVLPLNYGRISRTKLPYPTSDTETNSCKSIILRSYGRVFFCFAIVAEMPSPGYPFAERASYAQKAPEGYTARTKRVS
jgi:hypothetical protein